MMELSLEAIKRLGLPKGQYFSMSSKESKLMDALARANFCRLIEVKDA